MRKESSWVSGGVAPGEKVTARICLASENFYPVYAGPGVRFARYLPGLSARGIALQVFAGTPSAAFRLACFDNIAWREWKVGELLPIESMHGIPVNRVRLPESTGRRRRFLYANKLVSFCAQQSSAPDAIQLLSNDLSFVPALLRLRRLGIPTVYTFTLLPGPNGGRVKRELRRRHMALPLQLVSCIVVSSETMCAQLRDCRISTPIRIIPNGVDTRRFSPEWSNEDRQKVRRQFGIDFEDPVGLFVGPINRRKGLDVLLRAWTQLVPRHPRLQLLIVGPQMKKDDRDEAQFRREVESLVANSGVCDRIHFTGLVENVEDYMHAADVLVFTSRREGMPNVIPEAMASGLPVVTTPFIGLPSEFGAPGRQYLLADFEPGSVAVQIDSVLSNPRQRTELGRSGRKWVEDHLDVERSLNSYADLYIELASNSDQRKK